MAERARFGLGLSYLLSYFAVSTLSTGAADILVRLAKQAQSSSSLNLREPFMLRAVVMVIAFPFVPGLFSKKIRSHVTLAVTLAALGILWALVRYIKDATDLVILFVVMGLAEIVLESGLTVEQRILFGAEGAGTWMQARGIVFSVASFSVPLFSCA